jgi:transposase
MLDEFILTAYLLLDMKLVKAFSTSPSFTLSSRALEGLPLVNHFLDRLGLDACLQHYVPSTDSRLRLAPSTALGVLLRNILLSREPLYSMPSWAQSFEPSQLGLSLAETDGLNDDRIGRSLDRLFDADRASLMTEVIVRAIREFDIGLEELHNDSTTITFSGHYEGAKGNPRRGRPTLAITHGHNKDHRPDLKQILWILTVSADGAIPVHFRLCDGNTTDDQTHIQSWETLRKLIGRPDFLYVADSKLCVREAMTHIVAQGGRFLTILPKTRREEVWFREWIQKHTPDWKEVRRHPNPRRRDGTPDIYRVTQSPLRSSEGYRIVWVYSSLKAECDQKSRQGKIEKGILALEVLETRLRGKRCRFGNRSAVDKAVETALTTTGANRWLSITIEEKTEDHFRQETKGRPGSTTRYRRRQKNRFHLQWQPHPETIEYDAKTDGMFPLITNDENLPAGELLQKYKYQPQLEKRHEQLKTVCEIMPVYLKSVVRIEALLTVYFLALLINALIEREIRRRMKERGIRSLPLYPEERLCRAPTTDRLLDLFGNLKKHRLFDGKILVQTFQPTLSELQKEVLNLLGITPSAYTDCH